jgi:hypothetical protein
MSSVIQKFNCIDKNIIRLCLDEYNSSTTYDTTTMNKLTPRECLHLLVPLIQSHCEYKITYCTGNFYKHSEPYLPHTDFKTFQKNEINVVIPLAYTEALPNLIIFDQEWHLDSVTWCMHLPVQYFTTNIGVKGCPFEYPVRNLTNENICDELYTHLNHYPKETLYGLSGKAYPFDIGSLILFDNRRIHATSKFKGIKTGITLRFKINYD